MTSTPTPLDPQRDTQLLAIGKQCLHPSCLLVDFLPFTCQHCKEAYCQEHFMVSAHNCSKYDESKYNRIAPDCPLCNSPVAVRPGQDPNVRMEEHFIKECSVMTGKSGKPKFTPVCARGSCKKVLFSPIQCSKCKEQFCPAHRFPADHNCSSAAASSAPKPNASKLLANINTKNLNAKASATGAATLGAIKKTLSSAGPSAPVSKPVMVPKADSSAQAKPAASSSHSNPFSKTDRRAKAERESRRRAMQERAKKGLLTEEEKAIFAAEENETEGKGDCIVM